MSSREPVRTATRGRRLPALAPAAITVLVAAIVAIVAIVATVVTGFGGQSSAAAPALSGAGGDVGGVGGGGGVTVFDDRVPAVSGLDRALLDTVRRAATDAADDGVIFHVNSGWRSRDHQDRLLRDAIAQYGSAAEAARWVATADTSPHVEGDAIDIGGWDATAWLSAHGAAYGLCQIYANEPWHYELRPEAPTAGCPAMYTDPTYDPRMRQ